MQYDLVIIGGGIAGSSLAISMAGAGADVLLLERETRYRDRVRGEIIVPWGSVEAKKLGIYDTLVRTCAIEVPYHSSHFEGKLTNRRDLVTTTPENTKSICFVHAKMQEALISQALDCGVDVRRGARASGLTLGTLPKVQFRSGGCDAEVASRIVVGADGKNSKVRQWADLSVKRDPDRLVTCGLLVNGVKNVVDSADYYFDPSNGRGSYVLPVGENQTRLYLFYHHGTGYPRFSGERDFPRVLEACVATGIPGGTLEDASLAGPLATFPGAHVWIDAPAKPGIALIGDAACESDPTFGNGLSKALRDSRLLRDRLLDDDDWNRASAAYAKDHDVFYKGLHLIEDMFTVLFYEMGEEADARRNRALPLLRKDPARRPDAAGLGPEAPSDQEARLRFFGEI